MVAVALTVAQLFLAAPAEAPPELRVDEEAEPLPTGEPVTPPTEPAADPPPAEPLVEPSEVEEAPAVEASAPPVREHDTERAPRAGGDEDEEEDEETEYESAFGIEDDPRFARRGIVMSPGIGVQGCGNLFCEGFSAGVAGQLELGARWGRLMPTFGVEGATGRYDTTGLSEETGLDIVGKPRMRFLGLGVGFTAFFAKAGRFDPFVAARIGYSRVKFAYEEEGGAKLKEKVSRGALRLGGGLDIHLNRSLSLGGRFDVSIPFAGKLCVEALVRGETAEACYPVKDIEEDVRVDRRDLPLPFAFFLHLRWTIDVPWRPAATPKSESEFPWAMR